MLIFIDTEFTDFNHPQLISIGLVTEDGKNEFYGERRDFPVNECSSFVRSNVLPMLGPVAERQPDQVLSDSLYQWLIDQGPCAVVVDYQGDWNQMLRLLARQLPDNMSRQPIHLGDLQADEVFQAGYRNYFSKHDVPEHHALHDARANRMAWLGLSVAKRQRHLHDSGAADYDSVPQPRPFRRGPR